MSLGLSGLSVWRCAEAASAKRSKASLDPRRFIAVVSANLATDSAKELTRWCKFASLGPGLALAVSLSACSASDPLAPMCLAVGVAEVAGGGCQLVIPGAL